jgi:glycosyltransferase involved in cell wall biosynthesis
MRIALIAPPWLPVPPPAYGGTEAVIDRLARGFAMAGHEVLLFATGDSTCPVPTKWALAEAATERMGNVVAEIHHVAHAYEVVRSFDIIHDHTLIGPIFAAQFGDLPLVTTNHGPFDLELMSLYRSITPRVPIIAISHDQARSAPDVPIAAVIHHGVDPGEFPVGRGDGGYFMYLGRMAEDKGVRAAALVARRAGVPLMIAAKNREPAEREYFEREVRPLLGEGVVYLGEIGGAEKLELLGGARALLNPIEWPEPFGLVMIEALACGTPVLAFPNGSAPEIVEPGVTGFLCRDASELEAALGRVDELDRGACRRAVERSFSATRMVQEHLDLFTRLLAGGSEEHPTRAIPIQNGRRGRPRPPAGVDERLA